MRQRGAIPRTSLLSFAPRIVPVLALSLWLAVSSLPLDSTSVSAAPPDPGAITELVDSAASNDTTSPIDIESEHVAPLPHEPDANTLGGQPEIRNRTTRAWPGFESVRRRGLEAPVELRHREVAAVAEEADKGDGEPRQERTSPDKEEPKKRSPQQRGVRVWPMRANSYSFTQAFGCVPQIANFYFPGEGCPASAPVVHSGVDLAAPEGTPFYAAASGWVTDSGYDREVGVPNTRIIIQHDGRNEGFATEYLHWIASYVEVGDYVEAGDQIGEVGSVGYSTGPHLHFSVVDLETGEHTDPVRWLPDEPGIEGYRGRRPDTRAGMRLPAGTTAGLPESADPSPPPPPERQEVPESPRRDKGDKGNNRSSGKQQNNREARKADRRGRVEEDQADGLTDEDASTSETATDKVVSEGKDKERPRKRERNKNGQDKENAANGEDGGTRKSADESDEDAADNGANKGRRGYGNGNGRHNDKSDDEKVKQRKTNDRDQKDRDKLNNNGGDDGGDDDNSGGNNDGGGGTGADGGDGKDDVDGGNGSGDTSGDVPKDDNGGIDDGGKDQTDEDAADTGNDERGTGAVDSAEGVVAAAQQAGDETAAEPVRKSKRRKKA